SDYDGDGDQDLFVGVRLTPFRYGMPCKGYLLNNDGKGHFTDAGAKAGPGLANLGMITDASWLDYDSDGHPDLVITGEYMAIRIFHNENGVLRETTDAAGLTRTNGWWNRIQVADLNNDGYPDIIAGNHGLNSRFTASVKKPVTMYVGDFSGNGSTQQITSCFFGDTSYPMHLRHDLVAVLPALKKKYLKYESYKTQQVTDIFTSEQLAAATKLEAYTLESAVFLNNGKGGFEQKPLPITAQLSPVYGISVSDFNGDGKADLAIAGNLYQAKPEVGIYDASYGQVLLGDGKGNFTTVSSQQSGMFVRGAMRDIIQLKAGKDDILIVAQNNGPVHTFRKRVVIEKITGKK
ncbi:MAG: VCBS repeat-containing protein, partial [Pedobacter sp.]